MRLALLIASCLLLTVFGSNAQTNLTVKTQVGNAWQSWPNDPVFGSEESILHFGICANLFRDINERFALGVSPGFMRRGTDFEFGFMNGLIVGPPSFRAQLHLNYLQLPFLFQAQFPLKGKLGWFAQAGAGFSYLFSGYRETRPNFGMSQRLKLDFDERDAELNRFDFGWQLAAGVRYPIGKGELQFSFDFYQGQIDVDQKNTSKNRNLALGIGYQIPISQNTKQATN